MKELFTAIFHIANNNGDIDEAVMYSGGEFSRVTFKTENGTFAISIHKEKETDGNN